MEILFIGDLSLVTAAMFDKIDRSHQIIAYDESNQAQIKSENVTVFYSNKIEVEELINVFSFHTVVYISKSINSESRNVERLGLMEYILRLCGEQRVSQVLMLSSNRCSNLNKEQVTNKGLLIIDKALEDICNNASQFYEMSVQVLKVPYIYKATRNADSHPFFWHAANEKKVVFPGAANQEVDFISELDLGELLNRMIDEESPCPFQIIHASGENVYSFEELGNRLKKQIPDLDVKYSEYDENVPIYRMGQTARKEYGYYPMDVLEDTICHISLSRKLKWLEKMERSVKRRKNQRIRDIIRIRLEIILFFLLCQFVNDCVKDNSLLNFIDFRFIYVLIIGVSEGMLAGILASIFACFGYTIDNMAMMPWQLVLYNVQNWIPYGAYFLAGSIAGYLRDKSEDDLQFQKEEYAILEQKYHSLSTIYDEVREGKDAFNRQIISYRDSYGKLYNVVKKLDALLPEQVFFESVLVLEEMLETNSVAIYSVPKESAYCRLVVCSRAYTSVLRKSVRLDEYPKLTEILPENDMFVNTDALEDYPSYAVPIMRNDVLVGGILLMDVEQGQMSMEFMNKFRIVSALIRDSLLRAMDYQESIDESVGGLVALNAEHFKEVLSVNVEMKRNHLLDFMLLKLLTNESDMQKLSDQLCKLIRASDVVGYLDDGCLYLMLAQANIKDVGIVGKRLNDLGIGYEVIEDIEWFL